MNNIVVFDLDGVITSEETYWVTAGLVLHELLYSPRYWNIEEALTYEPPTSAEDCQHLSQQVLPQSVILALKARAVNSNWDTCYVGVGLCLIDLLSRLPDHGAALSPLCPWDAEWLAHLRRQLQEQPAPKLVFQEAYARLNNDLFRDVRGLDVIAQLDTLASQVLGQPVTHVFERSGPFWLLCQRLFQEWYLGEELFSLAEGHVPEQEGKFGCIHFEEPLLPKERLQFTLASLRERGYVLGVATGRPGQEATLPLKQYGLYDYFDEAHIVTHVEVAKAEERLRETGASISLVKPHHYSFARAFNPHYEPDQPIPPRGSFVVVGDTTSDVYGGKRAGAITIAVLTGARTEEAKQMLLQSQPDFVIEDVTHVPALLDHLDSLATIQRLQFHEREKAEMLLQRWFAHHMDLHVEQITLTPRAVSLNSFNGIYREGGEEYFFKTHVEEQGSLEEYYHAELLYNAGYNVVRALRTVHEKDQQMVIYPVIRDPVMFDLMRAVETGQPTEATVEILQAAELHECQRLLEIYAETLQPATAEEHAKAPIHQLFWHRLTGGRLTSFYAGQHVEFPGQDAQKELSGLAFEELARYRWVINGVELTERPTLGQVIEQAVYQLDPARPMLTVVGHGDAHFGNVFLEDWRRYKYFDPAFAGRHTPLLDVVKPLFHNVFATWMYFPQEVARDLQISVALHGNHVVVEHNYSLTPVRKAILETKLTSLLEPLLALLRKHDALPADWFDLFRLALVCCPLLTVNLLDRSKRPAEITWLGLSQVMQMGNLSFE